MRGTLRVGKWLAGVLGVACSLATADAGSCVWKVTASNGNVLYLGGSVHALRSTDYPLPAAFNHAFDASSRLVVETEQKSLQAMSRSLSKAGEYPKGDSLKNHVDPRTYDYLRRLFALARVPESTFSRYRPWFLVLAFQSPSSEAASLGVEGFLERRAAVNRKPVIGLESAPEHGAVFSGLTDRQGEALMLVSLIPRAPGTNENARMTAAWRRGDIETLARSTYDSFSDFPWFATRLLDERNRRWMPKIEGYLRGGETHFVVVGAAHLGGPAGLVPMLRARGYQLAQL